MIRSDGLEELRTGGGGVERKQDDGEPSLFITPVHNIIFLQPSVNDQMNSDCDHLYELLVGPHFVPVC